MSELFSKVSYALSNKRIIGKIFEEKMLKRNQTKTRPSNSFLFPAQNKTYVL